MSDTTVQQQERDVEGGDDSYDLQAEALKHLRTWSETFYSGCCGICGADMGGGEDSTLGMEDSMEGHYYEKHATHSFSCVLCGLDGECRMAEAYCEGPNDQSVRHLCENCTRPNSHDEEICPECAGLCIHQHGNYSSAAHCCEEGHLWR